MIIRDNIFSIFVAALFSLGVFNTAAKADEKDVLTWSTSLSSHPAGTLYKQGDAVLARYPMSALDAANGGGLAGVSTTDSEARFEWALAIIEMGMSEFTMTMLSGMPAATGWAETSDGEVSFAASFSGRVGSDREMLSIFFAPRATYERLGGMDMLANNRPRVSVDYAGGEKVASANAARTSTPMQQTTRPKPASPPSQTTTPRKSTTDGASLLAGVRGDMDRLGDKIAKERAIEKARADKLKAEAREARRHQLYRASGARPGNYPAPTAEEEFLVWPKKGIWGFQVPGDSASPRTATLSYSGADATPTAALRAFAKSHGLKIRRKANFEFLESYEGLDGRDMRIMLAETMMNRQVSIAFILYAKGKNSSTATLRVMEMPAKTYLQWGGVAGMLKMRGVIPEVEVFPATERKRIATSPLPEQIALYEAVLDKLYIENSLALMLTQAKTLEMMTELNYDLLFGNDITPGPWAD